MTFVRRVSVAVGALLVLLMATAGVGLGITVWLRSWHGDFVKAAEGTDVVNNPALQGLLDDVSSRANVHTIVIAVLAVAGLALGIVAIVLFRRSIGRRLGEAIAKLGSSASQLLGVASQVAASTAQTAAATNESVATVEQVKQMAMLAEEKTKEATELSEDLAERCQHGSQSATRNTGTFGHIRDDMDVVAEAIDRLNEQARSVGDIVTAVNDIAEQSNLLSVNASIEAAKAGEHGKGFSVVAQEVKALAEQSKQAVAQVRIVLGEIQKASDVAVQAVVQSRDAVEAGRVESSGAIENTVAELVVASKALEANQLISQTSRQQLAGMEQISQAMKSISDAGSQAASGTREVEREAQQLKELAISLQGIVGGTVE